MTATITGPEPPAAIRARRRQRHSPAVVAEARKLYAEGEGYTPTEIARHFASAGTVVHVNTIREWVTDQDTYRRSWQRQAHAAALAARRPESRAGWSANKTAQLLRLGLEFRAATPPVPYTAISVVFAHYENAKMSPDAIRAWLTANGAARDERKVRDLAAMKAAGRIPTRKAAA